MNSAHPIEDKAGAPGTGANIIAQTSRAALFARSTRTEAQRQRMLTMLRTGEKTTFDFRRAGIMQSSTRIFELRARGYGIQTVARRDLFDADGYRHERVAVYALLSEPEIGGDDRTSAPSDARKRTQRAALLHSPGATAHDGLRRTNEDKRNAVLLMLGDPEWTKLSDREIARRCVVSNTFVSALRTRKAPEPTSRAVSNHLARGDAA